MPVYDYHCSSHGSFALLRPIAARDDAVHCPECDQRLTRQVGAPRLGLMSPGNREAWARNERAAHEPRRASRGGCGHVHAPGESCGGAATANKLGGGRPGSRPWMLGH
ncbi:MAG: zinc ribbon domain-containing protein [Gammaproteobacteria bacterium]|nr:zinc ribbon domain-containing protein [Gammaproteobacteria bacterium]MCP5200114.1 zinc ribbon domain-containing protein [Gammaproteobacteria bacterium]